MSTGDPTMSIHAIFQDHLGRDATATELARFSGLGVDLIERDVQTIALGTPAFWRQNGKSLAKFIHGLMEETKGRRATRAEKVTNVDPLVVASSLDGCSR